MILKKTVLESGGGSSGQKSDSSAILGILLTVSGVVYLYLCIVLTVSGVV